MKTDTNLFSGTIQTVPIIMSLAIEIALKAWLIREQEKNSFPHIHDLVELFDRLKPTTKETLEVRMRNLSPDTFWGDQPSLIHVEPDFRKCWEQRWTLFARFWMLTETRICTLGICTKKREFHLTRVKWIKR